MNLTELSKEIHQDNKKKGFYDEQKEIGTILMLIVSELGEAMEAYRKSNIYIDNEIFNSTSECRNKIKIKKVYKDIISTKKNLPQLLYFERTIKDTFEDEIADTIIRLLDLCGYLDIDIESHIKTKLEYNKTRPYKHGKAF